MEEAPGQAAMRPMRPEIPLEVLGLVGPILTWVEGAQSQAIPKTWAGEPTRRPAQVLDELREFDGAASIQERGWLLHELPTFSLDNVDDVVDYSRRNKQGLGGSDRWRSPQTRVRPPQGYDLLHVLEILADRYLIWNGGKVAIQTGRMVELHELGLRMPLGFIVRHAHARSVGAGEQRMRDVADLPEAVSLLPSNAHGLRSVVRRGLSEGHLHLNSVHAAEVAWADHLLKSLRTKPRGFEQVEWRLLRLARAAVRLVALATTLLRADRVGATADLADLLVFFDAMYFAPTDLEMRFYEKQLRERIELTTGRQLRPVDLREADTWPRFRHKSYRLRQTCSQLGLLHWLDPHQRTQLWHSVTTSHEYRSVSSPIEREECLAQLHLAAHLALIQAPRKRRLGQQQPRGRNDEKGLLRWSYATPAGQFLHQTLFRYLVCQTHHWQLAVQQGRTTGLRHFKTYYDSNQRWPVLATDQERADSVLRRARDWRGLRVLEGRVAPPKQSRDLLPWLTSFAERGREGRVEKLGLIVHFIKVPEGAQSRNADFRPRFAKHRNTYRHQAFSLFRILERPSLVTPFIVGIDAANLELATPPEVFAPVFRFLRDRPIALLKADDLDLAAWQVNSGIRNIVESRRLGMTYHVGEEFRHLLSGLRAIDEVLEFLLPRSGDRIGHGTALGLEPQVWLDHIGRQALVPKQEWLDTLVWVHQLLGPGNDALGRLKVEEKIEHLGRELYLGQNEDSSRSITPLLLRDVWLLRQLDPEMFELDAHGEILFRPLAGDDSATWRWNGTMQRMLRAVRQRVGRNAPTDLLSRYWFSSITKSRGEELELVDMENDLENWLEVCCEAQRRMQHRVADRQIAVEVNPSVNRIIGPMSRYADHHIFKLTLDDDQQWKRRLRVTVNTDNPGTANTCLTHEFYLLGEALIGSGASEAEVVRWLEWLRKTGEESSFVRQLPKPSSTVMRRVTRRLRSIRRPLRQIRDPEALIRELWRRWPRPC